MSDQCRNCELIGDHDLCKAADCGKHSDWIVVEHKRRILELERKLSEYILKLKDLATENAWQTNALSELREERDRYCEALKQIADNLIITRDGNTRPSHFAKIARKALEAGNES